MSAERERVADGKTGRFRISEFLKARKSPLALGEISTGAPSSIFVLPFTLGPHALAIEATRVIEVRPGANAPISEGTEHTLTRADLHALLRAPPLAASETILARADDAVGRAAGACVSFSVDTIGTLRQVPIEALRPFPAILARRLEIDVLVGAIDLGALVEGPAATAAGGSGAADGLVLLVDPTRVARAARDEERR